MSMKSKILSVSVAVLLMACGSSGSSSEDDDVILDDAAAPTDVADTVAPVITVEPASLTVESGEALDFEVLATDSSGFDGDASLTCPSGGVTQTLESTEETQTISVSFVAPTISSETTVTCTAASTDSAGNLASLPVDILVTPAPIVIIDNDVDTSNFDGTWFSPCFNNTFGFSSRQTITIDGTNLDSDIQTFTGGDPSTFNCAAPADGLVITGEAVSTLSFGGTVTTGGCVNDSSVTTGVTVQSVDTSGNPSAVTEPEISDTLDLLTGEVDILPSSTQVCNLDNGNLLFGGVEYTPSAANGGTSSVNPIIISPSIDLQSDVTWSLGSNEFEADTAGGLANLPSNTGAITASSILENATGGFAGSALSLSHSLGGSGVYALTTQLELALSDLNDPEVRLVSINALVGNGEDGVGTNYISTEGSGFVIGVLDEDGLYHFSTQNPVTLDASSITGPAGGVPGAPSSFAFEMTNIFGFGE